MASVRVGEGACSPAGMQPAATEPCERGNDRRTHVNHPAPGLRFHKPKAKVELNLKAPQFKPDGTTPRLEQRTSGCRRFAKSQLRGLSWDAAYKRWRVRVSHGGKQLHIGRFSDELEAAHAYDAAVLHLFGSTAITNFAHDRQHRQGLAASGPPVTASAPAATWQAPPSSAAAHMPAGYAGAAAPAAVRCAPMMVSASPQLSSSSSQPTSSTLERCEGARGSGSSQTMPDLHAAAHAAHAPATACAQQQLQRQLLLEMQNQLLSQAQNPLLSQAHSPLLSHAQGPLPPHRHAQLQAQQQGQLQRLIEALLVHAQAPNSCPAAPQCAPAPFTPAAPAASHLCAAAELPTPPSQLRAWAQPQQPLAPPDAAQHSRAFTPSFGDNPVEPACVANPSSPGAASAQRARLAQLLQGSGDSEGALLHLLLAALQELAA